ncbi:MAG TPA: glycosyltransferase, partial [Nitrospirae bacterium]|nr:glycosyltransferase [Nitrospirota bacterium]
EYLEKIEYSGISSKVRIVDEYVPNEEIGIYFAAADLVVQPYISASGSGISQIAYGFDRPVIATDVGSLPEVVEDGVNGRIVEPGDAGGLAEAILESLDPHTLSRFSLNAAKTKEKFSWGKMAEIVSGEVDNTR